MDALTLDIPLPLNRPVDALGFTVQGLEPPLTQSRGDLALACHLIPAMAQGLTLQLDDAPDPVLLARLPLLGERLAAWNAGLNPVAVESLRPWGSDPRAAIATALFFTGGVDSFHALLARRESIDALVYVLGFDIHIGQERLRAETLAMLRAVAAHYGKRLIVVETNLRAYLDAYLAWGMSHGAALAAVSHLLGAAAGTFHVPGSFAQHQLHPWGTHPELDPLWSSSRVRLLHVDADRTRLDKVRAIAHDRFALQRLRVCWVNSGEAYNCGHCPKCLRTRVALELAEVDTRGLPFPGLLDPVAVAALGKGLADNDPERFFLRELAEGFVAAGRGDSPLGRALQRARGDLDASPVRVVTAAPLCLVVGPAVLDRVEGCIRLRAPVRCGEAVTEFRITYPDRTGPPPRPGDALAVWFVMAAMHKGVALHVADTVSSDLLEHLVEAQRVWTALPPFAGLRRVALTVDNPSPPLSRDARRPLAAAFGGGVDGWFSALRRRGQLGMLFFLHGLDQEVPDPAYRQQCSAWLQAAAASLGLPLIEADTNLRQIVAGTLGGRWDHTYVSGPLGFAHLLQGVASGIVIAGDLSYTELQRVHDTGQYHPLYDRWVGSAGMQIQFGDLEWPRHEKLGWLARVHPECLPHLWVCFARLTEGHKGGRNCGVCEKCLRTLAGFRVMGHEQAGAVAFDQPLDLSRLAALRIPDGPLGELRVSLLWSLLESLQVRGADLPLQEALASALANAEAPWPHGPLPVRIDPLPAWRASPAWSDVLSANAAHWCEQVLEAGDVPRDVLARDPALAAILAAQRVESRPGAVYRFILGALRRRLARAPAGLDCAEVRP